MAKPLVAGIPAALDLDGNYVVQFTALDALTGAVVSGVNVSNASLLVTNVTGVDLSTIDFGVTDLLLPIAEGQEQP